MCRIEVCDTGHELFSRRGHAAPRLDDHIICDELYQITWTTVDSEFRAALRAIGRFHCRGYNRRLARNSGNDCLFSPFSEGAAATMKSHTEHLTLNVSKRMDFVNITSRVEQAVRQSGVREGLCLVKATRTALRPEWTHRYGRG